jgi:hypothetical protein
MSKRIVIITGIWLAAAGSLWANGGENFPFHVGEKLTYQIFWGPFVAGRASLEVDGIESVDGKDCYHLIAQARTSGLADLLFHVESRTESWLDTQDFFTRRFRQRRVEGKHTKADDTHYDGPVQDVVSSLYYVRIKPLELNVDTNFRINVSDTNYNVNIRPDQRKTMYFRPTGHVSALRIEPKPTLNIVAANHGRMWFWVSDDRRKLPLLVSTDMKIGSAKLVLFKVDTANPADERPRPTLSYLPKPSLTARQ